MGRPIRGRVVERNGRIQASVPVARGASARRYELFDTRAQANAWCALAIAAIEAGLGVPPRDAVMPPSLSRAGDSSVNDESERDTIGQRPALTARRTRMKVADVAADWFHEVYVDGRSGGPERAKTVESILRRHVVSFLEPILDRGGALTRTQYRDHLAQLGRPFDASERRRGRPARQGMVQDVLNDVRRCLDGVLRHGVQLGVWHLDFDMSDVRTPRSRRPKTPKAAGLTLREVAAIASQLHAVHQVTLWTCRILTVRLGEAYGIRVGDIVHLDDDTGRGLLWLHAQGGRTFTLLDGEKVVQATHKEGMKHGYSERMQLVPSQLMSLFDDVIAVFHTDPDSGNVDLETRLIPGLSEADAGGQQAFRRALTQAAQRAGVATTAVHGFGRSVVGTPTPKDLRSSAVTDLEWVPGLDPTALRRFAGHAPGTDVHALHYVTDQPGNAKAAKLCEALEAMISNELPLGLRIPTTRRCVPRQGVGRVSASGKLGVEGSTSLR